MEGLPISPEIYIKEKAEQLQKNIVNFKSSTTSTVDNSIWISRSTVCDVLSVITTVAPVKHGDMKDIRMQSKEIKRLRAPVGRTPGKITPGNPLEDGQVVDQEKNHMLNCSLLRKERKEFMEKLRTSRFIRTVVENAASTILQKYFRRFRVRLNWQRIAETCVVNKQLRVALRSYFSANGQQAHMLLTPMQHRVNYTRLRYNSARTIQCAFRKFISRRVLQYRRHLAYMLRRRKMAVRIQCMARVRAANALVKLLRTRKKLGKYRRSALLIQTHVRMMLARRVVRKTLFKFRNIAARMIQCWYRSRHSKWKTSKIKELLIKQRQFIAALGLQGLVRRKVARQRVYRLRLRRLYLFVFVNVLQIQCMVRRRLCLLRVRRIRAERLKANKLKAEAEASAQRAAKEASNAAEKAAAAAAGKEIDVFELMRIGNTERVVELLSKQSADVQKSKGQTILMLTAQYGGESLVEKCIQEWGADVNLRGSEGLNALMASLKYRQHAVTKLLLSPAIKKNFNQPDLNQDGAAFLLLASIESIARSTTTSGRDEALDIFNNLVIVHGLAASINSKDGRYKNMTPIHMAAFSGSFDAFSMVVRNRPVVDVVDDLNRTPLHLASMSANASVDIVRTLLGLEVSSGIVVNEMKRSGMLLRTDAEGKDCLLLAALAGQAAVLHFMQDFILNDKNKGEATASQITWTLADTESALRLAELGDDVCLSYILGAGFDARSAGVIKPDTGALGLQVALPTRTNTSLAMAACLYGNLLFVNVLLDRGVNFVDQTDSLGQTSLHYAAACPNGASLMAHLLVHEKAKACGITEDALTLQDKAGWTPLHVAAWSGVELTVDLLARRGMEKALTLRENGPAGLTPLLMAAKYQQRAVMQLYLRVAEDATVVDRQGRNTLWWFFHPDTDAVGAASDAASAQASGSRPPSRPPSSEYLSRKGLLGKINKKEKDGATKTLELDIEMIKLLLAAKCPLYTSQLPPSTKDLLALKYEPGSAGSRADMEAGDLMVQELSLTALKVIPPVLSTNDCWRLTLGCIRFDDGTCKALISFLEGGAADVLASVPIKEKLSNKSITQLDKVYFNGLSVAAWCIKLGNSAALQQLLRRGLDPTLPCTAEGGNNCLHLAAMEGTGPMVEGIMGDKRILIEGVNANGFTAAMEASRAGNFQAARRLFANKASMRVGLDGKYWGWMLALARKQEETEKNLQTGRWGDDDERYFRIRVPGWILFSIENVKSTGSG